MSLKINIRETPNAAILDMSGRVTLGDALGDFRDSIREALAGDRKNILLNLAEVSYIDSSGLAVLIDAMQRIANYGGKFGMIGLRPAVRKILEISRLDQVFRVYPDRQAATEAT